MFREHIRYTGTLIPRELDLKVGTVEDLDKGNGPLIMRIHGDNMKGECRSPL